MEYYNANAEFLSYKEHFKREYGEKRGAKLLEIFEKICEDNSIKELIEECALDSIKYLEYELENGNLYIPLGSDDKELEWENTEELSEEEKSKIICRCCFDEEILWSEDEHFSVQYGEDFFYDIEEVLPKYTKEEITENEIYDMDQALSILLAKKIQEICKRKYGDMPL